MRLRYKYSVGHVQMIWHISNNRFLKTYFQRAGPYFFYLVLLIL